MSAPLTPIPEIVSTTKLDISKLDMFRAHYLILLELRMDLQKIWEEIVLSSKLGQVR